jgi:CheY-like chemotaxis protein
MMNQGMYLHLGCTSTILYVDDNPESIDLIGRILRSKTNCHLFSATLGQTGLAMAQRLRPDLIFLDLNLPDMSGLALLRYLRNDPLTRTIPVLVLSAEAHQEQIDKCMEAGAIEYIVKPYDLFGLLDVIHRLTHGRSEYATANFLEDVV